MYPTLPQELSRIRNFSQNQNTIEINRQIIHPRRNRNFQTPRVHFDIPQSPSPSTPENPISILPETPTLLSQRSTSSLPSDYLGSSYYLEKYFKQSIPYEQVNPSRKQSTDFRSIHNIEITLTRFQIYQETELACKYRNPLYKTQYSEKGSHKHNALNTKKVST